MCKASGGHRDKSSLVEVSNMKIIICIRHLACICRKWWRGVDYSWHVQHLLREFDLGQYTQVHSALRHLTDDGLLVSDETAQHNAGTAKAQGA
jgi:hypothetical protein